MNKEKLDRISELYHKSKISPLSEDELKEQKALRDEYRKGYVDNLTKQLENTKIINPDGSIKIVKRRSDVKK